MLLRSTAFMHLRQKLFFLVLRFVVVSVYQSAVIQVVEPLDQLFDVAGEHAVAVIVRQYVGKILVELFGRSAAARV